MMNKSIDYFVVVQSGKSKNDGERVKMFASQFSLFLPVKNVNFSSLTLHCARQKWLFLARKCLGKVSNYSESIPIIFK